jgi:hypothetical protein
MRLPLLAVAACVAALTGTPVSAQICTALTTTVSAATATLPTYSPIGTPTAATVGIQIRNNLLTACEVGLTFNGPFSPAVMTSAGAQLTYTIKDTSDTTTLLYVGASPGSTYLPIVAPVGTSVHNVHVVAIGGQFSARAGTYSDSAVSIQVFTRIGPLLLGLAASATLTVGTTVTKICSIGGTTAPSSDSATIPVGAGGAVDTTPIVRSYANTVCNTMTNITLSSGNSGVKSAAPAVGGFTNVINYSASASLGGATGTLNTATGSGTTGVISSADGATGTMSVTITPLTPPLPLVRGSYADTLSVLLAPQ